MWRVFVALVLGVLLNGCASLSDFMNILTGTSAQKITRTPIWVYRPDLQITVDGATFEGMGVTQLDAVKKIDIRSQVSISRVEISTCSRHDICQLKGGDLACDSNRFRIDRTWFGNPGRSMTYWFVPSAKEHDDSCANLMITIYDKNVLAAWGYLVLRTHPEENFPANFTCNAADWTFAGVSVCSAKAGTLQEISFTEPPDDWRAEDTCSLKKLSDKRFELQPSVGWCRASFMKNGKFHDVVLNGYDEVLLRDNK